MALIYTERARNAIMSATCFGVDDLQDIAHIFLNRLENGRTYAKIAHKIIRLTVEEVGGDQIIDLELH